MKYFLAHFDTKFPDYVNYCVKQIHKHDPKNDVYICGDYEPSFIEEDYTFIHRSDLDLPDFSYLKDASDPLWHTSLLRVFAINNFMWKYNYEGIIHFDNDVMIFGNFENIKNNFKKENYITPHKSTEYAFGFSYINNKEKFNELCVKILELISKGENKVKALTGDEAHEMRLLGYCADELIIPLPVHPSLGSIDNCIFDPSSWGQYVAGTPAGHSRGFIDEKQLVGSILSKEEEKPTLLYKKSSDTYHIKFKDRIYQVFNLHIHKKNLKVFSK